MIKRWKIANFKSIRDETTLELAPLTIFAGANSSGKSTVLQSILLIAQTLQHKVSSKSVVLNGSLCNLGQFGDLISAKGKLVAGVDQIFIGWHCEPISKDEPTANRVKEINSVTCELSFDNISSKSEDDVENCQVQPLINRFKLDANLIGHDSNDDSVSMCASYLDYQDYENCHIKNFFIDSMKWMSELYPGKVNFDFYNEIERMKIKIDDSSWSDADKEVSRFAYIYPAFNHFLLEKIIYLTINPMKITSAFISILIYSDNRQELSIKEILDIEFSDYIQEKVKLPVESLIGFFESKEFHNNDHYNYVISRTFMKKLRDIPNKMISLKSWADFIQQLHPKTRKNAIRSLSSRDNIKIPIIKLVTGCIEFLKYPPEFHSILPKAIRFNEGNPYIGIFEKESKPLSTAIEYVDDFFSKQVKYLGPLRSEPKFIYPIGTLIDPRDIGVRGEQTAAVLHRHRRTIIKYLPSAKFSLENSNLSEANRNPVSKSLMDAVCEWAQYLGIVEDIQISDRGRLGHGIMVGQDRKITPDGSGDTELHQEFLSHIPKAHLEEYEAGYPDPYIDFLRKEFDNSQYLTHVGIGVSQVLPILVMGLLSKEDTTLIFEQPELHLHPLVQTRLADFFLSMALLNKQCIIETHSEHLINRLRFRAASAEEPLTDTSKIYFVEKKDGASQFREVVINEYGSIEDWPSGFFDQSYTEAENILMASIKKRKKMRKRKDQ